MTTRAPTGHIAGASHHKAKLDTETVKEMRATHAKLKQEGRTGYGGIGYGWFAGRYGCSESTARDILNYRTRIAS